MDVDVSTTFVSEPSVKRFESDSIDDVSGLLDSLMERLASVGLDGLLDFASPA